MYAYAPYFHDFYGQPAALEVTNIKFEPRYEIEVAKAGEYGSRTTFPGNRRRFR